MEAQRTSRNLLESDEFLFVTYSNEEAFRCLFAVVKLESLGQTISVDFTSRNDFNQKSSLKASKHEAFFHLSI
ncbi:CLUMA_CG013446, isoform A [Clunio marinus]|uniref:CLUMA_CG013446, isoform A n=1 Tax=Clunio marinus TaxID=568069 RepID=A0A1J1IIX3_9DIPT|nr:CLUMA_CG013446, isoform A [Clunio marinus]